MSKPEYVFHTAKGPSTTTLSITPLGSNPGSRSRHLSLDSSHELYQELCKLVQRSASMEEINQLFGKVEALLAAEVAKQQKAAVASSEPEVRQFIYDEATDHLSYGDIQLPKGVLEKVKEMISQGFSLTPMTNFMERLLKNPSFRVRAQLFDFLEFGKVPLTPEGTFLAYKAVRADFKDIHSGKFDNSVGAVVTMPRAEVNDDPNITCSAGLHVCSFDYLSFFSHADGHVMICEVDPADVVSIPADYHNTKMRCCKYTVVSEWTGYYDEQREKQKHYLASASVMSGTDTSLPFEVRAYWDGNERNEYEVLDSAVLRRQAWGAFNDAVENHDSDEYVRITLIDTTTDSVLDSADGEGTFADEEAYGDSLFDEENTDDVVHVVSTSRDAFDTSAYVSQTFDNGSQAINHVYDENLLATYSTLYIVCTDGDTKPITLTQ